jgi:EAL domain-containing protein (putative c-di-GMP-specific phosphodiesterase class I)
MDILSRLRLKGLELALDDFGTGYSSLKQLRQLPFSALKIDRSFIADMATSRDSLAIIKSTIDLARNMELESVAEGVETEADAACLSALGIDASQGFLIARPLPADQVPAWLTSQSLGRN